MSINEVAEGLVGLCKEGKFREAIDSYYANDIVSVEAHGDPREVRGIDAIRGKQEWFANTFEVHGASCEGPWVNEPYFIAKFEIDVTDKGSGNRMTMNEHAVYEVRDGKIVHERFF